jgi:hypothetical protein
MEEQNAEILRLTARLAEADRKLEALRRAGETALRIGREAEEARLRYAAGDPTRTWADPDSGDDL